MPDDEIRSKRKQTIIIALGATESSPVDAQDAVLFSLIMPAALTGTAIHYEGSADGGVFVDMYDAFNVQVTQTVAAGRAYDVPAEVSTYPWWRIVSGTAEAAKRSIIVCSKQ